RCGSGRVDGHVMQRSGRMVSGGDVESVIGVDPKGKYVVYTADQDTDGTAELYRSDLVTGENLKLNGPLLSGGNVQTPVLLDPKGPYLVYRPDQDEAGKTQLDRSDLKTGEFIKLNPVLPPLREVQPEVKLDPTGKWAVFVTGTFDPADGVEPVRLQRSDLKTGAALELTPQVTGGAIGVKTFDFI